MVSLHRSVITVLRSRISWSAGLAALRQSIPRVGAARDPYDTPTAQAAGHAPGADTRATISPKGAAREDHRYRDVRRGCGVAPLAVRRGPDRRWHHGVRRVL